ncbi:MAG: hypothetical protein EBU57_02185, partial [Alphaproteobacteria bacterium]|nr:hypothetical protein [Alphaproteobacteria bacterium]
MSSSCTDTTAGYVYVLGSCRDGKWRTYVGWTTDMDARLDAHNAGKGAKSTRGFVRKVHVHLRRVRLFRELDAAAPRGVPVRAAPYEVV